MDRIEATPIRILLVDDHAVLRAGLRAIISNHRGMAVVGEAGDTAAALAAAATTKPDITLLDLDLGDESGVELLPGLLEVAPDTRVILLTGLRDPQVHRRAILLGAVGLVLKEKAVETVIKAIEKVHAGEVWLDRAMIASILNARVRGEQAQQSPGDKRIETLTAREREVIELIGAGLKNRQIAERLVISEATVRHHLTSIFGKLGVEDRFDLALFAYRHGLAKLPE